MLRLCVPNDAAVWDDVSIQRDRNGSSALPSAQGFDPAVVAAIGGVLHRLRQIDDIKTRLLASGLSFTQRGLVTNAADLVGALIEACASAQAQDAAELPKVVERALDPAAADTEAARIAVADSLAIVRAMAIRLQDGMLNHSQAHLVRETVLLCEHLQQAWQAVLTTQDSALAAVAPQVPDCPDTQGAPADECAGNLWDLLRSLTSRLAATSMDVRQRKLVAQIDGVTAALHLAAIGGGARTPIASRIAAYDHDAADVVYLDDLADCLVDHAGDRDELNWVNATGESDDAFEIDDIPPSSADDSLFELVDFELSAQADNDPIELVDVDPTEDARQVA